MKIPDPSSRPETNEDNYRHWQSVFKDKDDDYIRANRGFDENQTRAANDQLLENQRQREDKRFKAHDEQIASIKDDVASIRKKTDIPEHKTKTFKVAVWAIVISVGTFLMGLARDVFDFRLRWHKAGTESHGTSPSLDSQQQSRPQVPQQTDRTPPQTNAAVTNPISAPAPLPASQQAKPSTPAPSERQ